MQRSECWNFTSPAPSAQEVPFLLEESTSGECELAMSTPPCLLSHLVQLSQSLLSAQGPKMAILNVVCTFLKLPFLHLADASTYIILLQKDWNGTDWNVLVTPLKKTEIRIRIGFYF